MFSWPKGVRRSCRQTHHCQPAPVHSAPFAPGEVAVLTSFLSLRVAPLLCLTLVAASAAKSDFTGLSGSCSGSGACVLTIDAPKVVTAGFDLSGIVFYSARNPDGSDAPGENGTFNIWRLNADGTGLAPITSVIADGAGGYRSQWSPDGTEVVFDSTRKLDGTDAPNPNGTSNIWRVHIDGTGLVPLTNATADGAGSFRPEWSPDGAQVVFDSTRNLDGMDAPRPVRHSQSLATKGISSR